MTELRKSEALGRLIRCDELPTLGVSAWTLAVEAIRAGRTEDAVRFIEYGSSEAKRAHDSMVTFVDDVLTYLADFGEEEIYQVVRKRYYSRVRHSLAGKPSVEELLRLSIESQRGHGGEVTVSEEPDRYVVKCDPCGSGGQLRRTRDVAKTKKAYPWMWGKSGVPYYCCHCCVSEIVAIELRGYPIRITMIGDKPGDLCVHYYYKRPEAIPEEYFTRIGVSKTIK